MGAQVGEIDIDSELVASAQQLEGREDIIMMLNNGCLCCTVRDDLIGMLKELVSSWGPPNSNSKMQKLPESPECRRFILIPRMRHNNR